MDRRKIEFSICGIETVADCRIKSDRHESWLVGIDTLTNKKTGLEIDFLGLGILTRQMVFEKVEETFEDMKKQGCFDSVDNSVYLPKEA